MDYTKGAIVAAAVGGIFSLATPVLAQSYGSYGAYSPTPSYAYPLYGPSYGIYQSPMIIQMTGQFTSIPSYVNMPMYAMPSMMYGMMNGGGYMSNTYDQQYPQQYPQYQSQYYSAPQYSYEYPVYSYNTPQYSYPAYDSSYAPYSNYYTTYPQQNLGFTGDKDAFGNDLCYWEGYGRSNCDYNPHQWVYDPYSGSWY